MMLDAAISAVPQLRSACSSASDRAGTPGSGVRVMRLVSKQLRISMLSAVQGYTLHLDGNGFSLLHEMAVLHSTTLSRLCVVVTASAHGGCLNSLHGWDAHVLQLGCFLRGMGVAIKGITLLKVNALSVGGTSSEAVGAMLSELASACPALQQLQLTGDVGKALLDALGMSCQKLSCLEVMKGVTSKTLQQLHLTLPGLTTCKISSNEQGSRPTPYRYAIDCCRFMFPCPHLTCMDVGWTIPDWLWNRLPNCIRELHCSLSPSPPVGLKLLPNLQLLRYKQPCFCLSNSTLAAILRAVPNLKTLMILDGDPCSDQSSIMPEIYSASSDAGIVDLVYLHDCVLSGLEVTSSICGGRGDFLGVNVYIWIGEGVEHGYQYAADYFAALPIFPAFKGLRLSSDTLQPNFSSLMQDISRVFPHLEALSLQLEGSFCSRDLIHLGVFTGLHHLLLGDVKLCIASLAMLSNRLPLLQVLYLIECGDFDAAKGNDLQVLLQDWGIPTQVLVVEQD